MMPDLEAALSVQRGDGFWQAFADPRYESLNAMFGGWTAAVALRSVNHSTERELMPSAITVNFVDRIEPGTEIHIHTRQVGSTRSIEHWLAELTPPDTDRTLAVATAVLTDRRETDGYTQASMPHAPDPEALEVFHPPGPHGERMVSRPISGSPPFGQMDTASTAWVRETSGRQVDHVQLALLADQAAPRPFFWSDAPRPCATMSMSVYFHATDEEIAAIGDDYVLSEVTGSRGAHSTSDQHTLLWSKWGALLATSEQLCWYR